MSVQFISHISEIAANTIKYCNACKHFRHNPHDINGISGTCFLFKQINLVSADKQYVNAKLVRLDDALCGRDGHYFEKITKPPMH